jgi:hypothetical protein
MVRKVSSQGEKKTDDGAAPRVRVLARAMRALLSHADPSVRAAAEAALAEAASARPYTVAELEALVVNDLLARAAALRGGLWSREDDLALGAVRYLEELATHPRGALLERRARADRGALLGAIQSALRLLGDRKGPGRPALTAEPGRAASAVRNVLVALGLRSRADSDDAVRKLLERHQASTARAEYSSLETINAAEGERFPVRETLGAIEEDAFSVAVEELSDLGVNLGRVARLLALLDRK